MPDRATRFQLRELRLSTRTRLSRLDEAPERYGVWLPDAPVAIRGVGLGRQPPGRLGRKGTRTDWRVRGWGSVSPLSNLLAAGFLGLHLFIGGNRVDPR